MRKATIAAAGTALGALAIATQARRRGTSVRGWLIGKVALPVLMRRKMEDADRIRTLIARNHAKGPALPPARLAKRFREQAGPGCRLFRLTPDKTTVPGRRILYIHGGAYVFDLMKAQWSIIAGLADRTGSEVVAPIYPLAPEAQVEAGLDAVEAAYEALLAEVGAGAVDLVGESAGGGLALALVQRLAAKGRPLPSRQLLFFPWLDATVSGEDQPALEPSDTVLSIARLRDAGRMWAGDLTPASPLASPLFGDLSNLPPTLVLAGTDDILLSDAHRLRARAPAVALREYRGMFHGWISTPIPEASRALDAGASFLRGEENPAA